MRIQDEDLGLGFRVSFKGKDLGSEFKVRILDQDLGLGFQVKVRVKIQSKDSG